MVVAGQAGSKSTFIGGMYQHVHRQENISINYRKVEGDVDNDFFNGVIKQMTTRGVYPDQTKEGYVVELTMSHGSTLVPDPTLEFVDIPGEQIDRVLSRVWDDIKAGNIETSESDFQSVRSKIGGDQALSVDDWETVFKYYYSNASMVIFLVNLHKIIIRDESPTVGTDELEQISKDKIKVAVVPTAVDLLGYDPEDSNLKNKLGLGSRSYDKKLKEHIESHLTLGDAPELLNLLQHVEQNKKLDFFGTSVPPANPKNTDSEDLASSSDGGFQTSGFEEVIEWLKD
jgi:hypothetical protein